MAKEIDDIVRKAVSQGWEVTTRKNGHLQFKPPTKDPVIFFSGTPSDFRALKNHLAHMKRLGFIK